MLLTTFPEAKTTPHEEAERIFDRMGREYKDDYLDLYKVLAREKGLYIVGGTSERHAGRWCISGCPHSQGWPPRASGRRVMLRRVSRAEPSSGIPQEVLLETPCPKRTSSPYSQTWQTRRRGPDAIPDAILMAVSLDRFAAAA
jgi:hypothetical protein